MNHYHTILFDLDGTLTDPGIGITNSAMYALKKFGITITDRSKLYPFIGPPLLDSFEKYYHFTPNEAKTAVTYYREYYTDKGIYENLLYPGIDALLRSLNASGRKVILATSKPEPFAEKILKHFHLLNYFDFVGGALLDETRTAKDEVIAHVLTSCNIDVAGTVMIGDREYDIIGARKNGLASIGVLYGYGSREELENAGADCIAESVTDLQNILLK